MAEYPEIGLHLDVLYKIMFSGLETRDILRCMKVCKSWKAQLSHKQFWKELIQQKFDLTVETDIEKLEGSLYQWSHPNIWACYFEDNNEDPYVIRPFPSMWKCGVVVPNALDTLSLDVQHLQSLCRSLEILVQMREGIHEFGLLCGNECSGNEGANHLSVVLMPWESEELPDKLTVFNKLFQFHHEVWENQLDFCNSHFDEKLSFHLESNGHPRGSKKPCLNKVFGRPGKYFWEEKNYDYQRELAFFLWLQNIMVPSRLYVAGDGRLNPVAEFFITTLAPGWVGGILTGETWT